MMKAYWTRSTHFQGTSKRIEQDGKEQERSTAVETACILSGGKATSAARFDSTTTQDKLTDGKL